MASEDTTTLREALERLTAITEHIIAQPRFSLPGHPAVSYEHLDRDAHHQAREAVTVAREALAATSEPEWDGVAPREIVRRAVCPDCDAEHGQSCRPLDRTCQNCGHACDHLPGGTCIFPRCGCRHLVRKADRKHRPRVDLRYVLTGRTSEPEYEYRATAGPLTSRAARSEAEAQMLADTISFYEPQHIERRVKPGPWERI